MERKEKHNATPAPIYLVTGGAGFIGSNLCEALLKQKARVRCLDNLSTGKREQVERFQGETGYEFLEGDIRELAVCEAACEGVDYVLHQAAWGSVPRSIAHPVLYEEINIHGTLTVMEAARRQKVKKLVYASSSSVYGDHPALPKREGQEGTVLSPYALTKRTNEAYGRLYTDLYGLETYGLRYFNVFGKWQNPEGAYAAVIPRFIQTLLNGETPIIQGDGKQSRDFTYIDNVVSANLKACEASQEAAGQAYNIAGGERETLEEVYQTICGLLHEEKKPIYEETRTGDIRHSHADIQKAKEWLGYEPQVDFQTGIRKTVAWYQGAR